MPLGEEQTRALSEPFDSARVRKREGPGGRELSYIAGHDAIRTANRIFGYGQWGYNVAALDHIGTERYTTRNDVKMVRVAYRCTVSLFVEGGATTSGVGYGDATERYYESETELTAHELAMKESETDAMKRALKNFGDQFGLLLYDEDRRKLLEGSASDAEISDAIKTMVAAGMSETAVKEAIVLQRERFDGLVPRGWLQRQVQRAQGEEPPAADEVPYG